MSPGGFFSGVRGFSEARGGPFAAWANRDTGANATRLIIVAVTMSVAIFTFDLLSVWKAAETYFRRYIFLSARSYCGVERFSASMSFGEANRFDRQRSTARNRCLAINNRNGRPKAATHRCARRMMSAPQSPS